VYDETEELHILRAASADHTPFPLYACATCRRMFQRAPSRALSVRKHLIAGRNELCPGSLAAPLRPSRSVTHLMVPSAPLLACCGQPPSGVPAFDTFTQARARATCPGCTTGTGKDQQST
jgi:hypothetical protein